MYLVRSRNSKTEMANCFTTDETTRIQDLMDIIEMLPLKYDENDDARGCLQVEGMTFVKAVRNDRTYYAISTPYPNGDEGKKMLLRVIIYGDDPSGAVRVKVFHNGQWVNRLRAAFLNLENDPFAPIYF